MIKNSVIVLLVVFFISSCSDAPTSVGVNLLGDDYIGFKTINSVEDSIGQTSTYFHKVASLGSSDMLLLGSAKDVEASTLIRFGTVLLDSIATDINNNNINVTSAVIQLHRTYAFGDTLAPFDFTVHKVNSEWTTGFTEDSLPGLQYDADDISSQKEITDTVTNITISNDLVMQWLQSTADTTLPAQNGIYLKPASGQNHIIGYKALTADYTDYPTLTAVIEKPGVYVDTLTFVSAYDVSVVEGNIPAVSSGNLIIRSGFLIFSRLTFYMPELPKDAIINSAELTLNVDTVETVVGANYLNSINAYFALDSTNTDSVSSYVSLARDGNQFTGTITNFVRQWVKGNNNGIILTTSSPFDGFELFTIKGSSSANLNDRPYLKITYTSK